MAGENCVLTADEVLDPNFTVIRSFGINMDLIDKIARYIIAYTALILLAITAAELIWRELSKFLG